MKSKLLRNFGPFIVLVALTVAACNNPDGKGTDSYDRTYPESAVPVSSEMMIPDGMENLDDDPNVVWSAGINVHIYDLEATETSFSNIIHTYLYTGGMINARLDIGSTLTREQSFSLVILADGKPIDFAVEGTSYHAYPFEANHGTNRFEVSFDPGLSQGRVDFVLVFHGNGQNDIHSYSVKYTIYLGEEKERASFEAEEQVITGPKFSGVRQMADGYTLFAMLRDPNETEEEFEFSEGDFLLGEDHQALLYIVSGYEGYFRTVCFLDDQQTPVLVDGKEYHSFVWKSSQDQMIREKITLQLPEEWEGRRFYTISTPLEIESIALPPRFSSKYVLHADKE